MDIFYRPIGVIRSPFTDPESMPVQPVGAESARGVIEVDPSYEEGLRDLEASPISILIYHFHKSRPCRLTITPFLDTQSSRPLLDARAVATQSDRPVDRGVARRRGQSPFRREARHTRRDAASRHQALCARIRQPARRSRRDGSKRLGAPPRPNSRTAASRRESVKLGTR